MPPRFVNQGPDKRFGGPLGHVLAWLQWRLSFLSTTPPFQWIARWGFGNRRYKVGIEWSRPWLLPFVLVFIPRQDWPGRWRSFRIGWRWDGNWGDVHSPDHAYFVENGWRPGGYIADVIVKSRIDNLVE